jgi:hypothetical protein
LTIATEVHTWATAFILPLRVCRQYKATLDGDVAVMRIFVITLQPVAQGVERPGHLGMSAWREISDLGVWMPANTSSPWALARHSP